MNTYGGFGVYIHLGTTWRWAISFARQPLYTMGKTLRYSWTGGWGRGDPRAGLHNLVKWKVLPYSDSNTDPSVTHPISIRYTHCATATPRGSSCEHDSEPLVAWPADQLLKNVSWVIGDRALSHIAVAKPIPDLKGTQGLRWSTHSLRR
jgi:hypothetical protein